ncbi:hypothetical protein [Allorhizocola rhizosphaerae]|nr:hypothetical protein [Allorhizocola rhizosphaerae]
MPIDSVYRHYEDDGRLSMFTSGGEILITCSEGHLRRLRADETG